MRATAARKTSRTWPTYLADSPTVLVVAFGLAGAIGDAIQQRLKPTPLKALSASAGVLLVSAALSALAPPAAWPLATGLGGLWGDAVTGVAVGGLRALRIPGATILVGVLFALLGLGFPVWVGRRRRAALAEDAGVDTEGVVLEGHAAGLLAAQSHEVGLMIVGSRGYGPLGAVLLGGTSHSLLREAACPLIVTPRAHTGT